MFVKKVYASGGGGAGSQNRAGSGNNTINSTNAQRRGNESMGNYIRRTGTAFGTRVGQGQRGNYAGTQRVR